MIGKYLRWRLTRTNRALTAAVLHQQALRSEPGGEYQRVSAEVRRLRCKATRIVDLLVAHGGRSGDW